MDSQPNFLSVALVVMCALSTVRGAMASITTMPFVAQALQVLGLVYLAQMAWARVGGPGRGQVGGQVRQYGWDWRALVPTTPSTTPSATPSAS